MRRSLEDLVVVAQTFVGMEDLLIYPAMFLCCSRLGMRDHYAFCVFCFPAIPLCAVMFPTNDVFPKKV